VTIPGSDRFQLAPTAIGALIVVEAVLIPGTIHATQGSPLIGRTLVAIAFIAPVSFGLGFWFPIGMRLVGRHSSQITAWMWAVNGACGVLASIIAVMVSLWLGIQANLLFAAVLYALLTLALRALRSPV
jgi:hypothetical protein